LNRHRHRLAAIEMAYRFTRDFQCVTVIFGKMIGYPGDTGMYIGTAQRFGIHHLAGGSLHQRRAAEEDRALFAHDDAFITHCRHVGATRRTRAHHHRDLRDILCAHARLVVENPPEVFFIGEYLILQWQKCTAGIHQIDTRQVIFARHFLGAQMFFHCHRKVGATLHRGVIGQHHHFTTVYAADTSDQPGAWCGAIVHPFSRQRAQFQER
jgi:hypothetical protein